MTETEIKELFNNDDIDRATLEQELEKQLFSEYLNLELNTIA